MRAFIVFMLSNDSQAFFVLGLLGALVSLSRKRQTLTGPIIVEALLAYFVLCAVGLYLVYHFVLHVAFAEMTARSIGWENSPFQYEVGWACLGFGLVGIAAFRGSRGLRVAAVLGPTAFLWGTAIGHLYQRVTAHDEAPGNPGILFWGAILLPVIGWLLLWLSRPPRKARLA